MRSTSAQRDLLDLLDNPLKIGHTGLEFTYTRFEGCGCVAVPRGGSSRGITGIISVASHSRSGAGDCVQPR